MADPLDSFPTFVAAVHARLRAGRATYGDRSFEREPAELLGELEQEALDLAGWGFILFERIRRQRAALAELDGAATTRAEIAPVGEVISSGKRNPPGASGIVSLQDNTRARVGRMIMVPAQGVLCAPLLALGTTPQTWRELPPIALSRVPVQGECVLDAEGRNLHVLGVRHLQGVAAELHCEHLRASHELPAANEGGEPVNVESAKP